MAEARVHGSRAVIAVADARIRGGRGAGSRLARARGSQHEAEFAVGVGRRGAVQVSRHGAGFAVVGAAQGSRARARCRVRGAGAVRSS